MFLLCYTWVVFIKQQAAWRLKRQRNIREGPQGQVWPAGCGGRQCCYDPPPEEHQAVPAARPLLRYTCCSLSPTLTPGVPPDCSLDGLSSPPATGQGVVVPLSILSCCYWCGDVRTLWPHPPPTHLTRPTHPPPTVALSLQAPSVCFQDGGHRPWNGPVWYSQPISHEAT